MFRAYVHADDQMFRAHVHMTQRALDLCPCFGSCL
jgi:hypothetical protein